MPDEPLVDDETEDGNLFDAYLAEMRSIGGLSGSPVFIVRWRRPPDYLPEHLIEQATNGNPVRLAEYIIKFASDPPTTHFFGMVRGHYDFKKQGHDSALQDIDAQEIERLNAGIAVITPAWDVLDILDGEDYWNKRREAAEERRTETT
jgi:hypothetical protein